MTQLIDRAIGHFERGRYLAALVLLERACHAAPDDADAWQWRCRTLLTLGRVDEAQRVQNVPMKLNGVAEQ